MEEPGPPESATKEARRLRAQERKIRKKASQKDKKERQEQERLAAQEAGEAATARSQQGVLPIIKELSQISIQDTPAFTAATSSTSAPPVPAKANFAKADILIEIPSARPIPSNLDLRTSSARPSTLPTQSPVHARVAALRTAATDPTGYSSHCPTDLKGPSPSQDPDSEETPPSFALVFFDNNHPKTRCRLPDCRKMTNCWGKLLLASFILRAYLTHRRIHRHLPSLWNRLLRSILRDRTPLRRLTATLGGGLREGSSRRKDQARYHQRLSDTIKTLCGRTRVGFYRATS
jgi:hypothetical protein